MAGEAGGVSGAAPRKFVSLFGGSRENSDLVGIAKSACKEGYAVIPVKPGTKEPLCTLTDRQRTQADREAATTAREAGVKHWERKRHPCGRAHAITDPVVAERVFKRLVTKHPDLNIGLEVGASRLLVVDADTTAERESFALLWARMEERPELAQAAPTVRSPGKRRVEHTNGNGAEIWAHKDGGHFWFLLPDEVDFAHACTSAPLKLGANEAKASLMYRDQLVLVPPSVREEGPYVMASDIQPAPAWMIERLHAHIAGHAERIDRHRERNLDGDDPVEDWAAATPWDSILTPYGWTTSGRTDQCGCEIWTRPGDWSSPKSATAHEPSCELREVVGGVLHLWTDSPPAELSGRKDWSKLQVVAAYEHDGDARDAMTAVGILDAPAELRSMDRSRVAELLASSSFGTSDDEPEDDDAGESEDGEPDPVDALLAELIPASDLDKIPPPAPLVNGLLDRNSLARVIGKSGHGKSFFMIDLAGHVALGMPWHGRDCAQGDVVYMVAEGATGIRKRVRAWERHHGVELGERVKFLPRPVQVKDHEWLVWVAAMAKLKPSLIVIDTQARVTAGANENGPEDMGMLVHRAELLRQQTGACVVLVHHKGHNGDHGRGHSSVIAAMDAEIEVAKEGRGKITVLSTKQKDQEDFEPIRLDLVKVGLGGTGSAVLVAPGQAANEGDPLAADPVVDEQSTARDRLAKWIYAGFNGGGGGTKAEIKSYVGERDRSRRGKPMSKAAFFEAWRDLERDAVLVDMGTSRFILATAEVERLGLKNDA